MGDNTIPPSWEWLVSPLGEDLLADKFRPTMTADCGCRFALDHGEWLLDSPCEAASGSGEHTKAAAECAFRNHVVRTLTR